MFEGDPGRSWQIHLGDDWLLSTLVWVRDDCGLVGLVQPDLPPCLPAVPVGAALSRERAEDAADAWTGLWRRVVRDEDPRHVGVWPQPDDAGSLVGAGPGTAHLRAALAQGRDRLHDWQATAGRGRGRPVALGRTVARHERRLGRTARPFRLDVVELPVAGRQGWVLDDGHVLVTVGLAEDQEAFVELLDPVIARLV